MVRSTRSAAVKAPLQTTDSSTASNTASNAASQTSTPVPNDTDERAEPHRERAHDLDGASLGDDPQSADINKSTAQRDYDGDLEPLGLHVKDALKTISRLQGLGLQRLKIPLPKCIVLGEQSTGKSSVIEAISGIKTPRADDTCTRCPLFITLEPSEDPRAAWSACVTLRKEYRFEQQKTTRKNAKFPGWKELDRTERIEFARTDDQNKLEDIIARAQLATISPLVASLDFLHKPMTTFKNLHKCEFSPNIVCISISAPELPSLSFYDLPGIIGQAETSEAQFLVKFVRDLVTDYIKDPESLILLTCSLENEIANSTAGGIARELKATDRCVGVLTKPDRLPTGSRPEKLQEVLADKRFSLGHGYFVVKNLNQDEINQGLSNKDARLSEKRFFEHESPWKEDFRSFKSRFGTLNLQRFLSGKLAKQITDKLPIIHEEMKNRLQEVDEALKQFPEPQKINAQRTIFDILTDFSMVVRKELEADYPHTVWRSNWESLQKDFFTSLMSLKPVMMTSGARDRGLYLETLKTQSNAGTSKEDSITIDDEGDDSSADDAARAPSFPVTPMKKRKFEDDSPFRTPSKKQVAGPPRAESQCPDFSDKRQRFELDDVAEYLNQRSKSRVPGQIEPRVLCAMMLQGLHDWKSPLEAFFVLLREQMQSQMLAIFHEHFSKWQGSALYAAAWTIVDEMLRVNFDQQQTIMAADSFEDETQNPYIFHQDLFRREKESMLHLYSQARSGTRLNIYKEERKEHTGKELSPADETRIKKEEKTMALINAEPYRVELGVVAEITTYYVFATRRFHDAVCMRIESKFFKQLKNQLRDELENRLGIHDEDNGKQNAEDLLVEQSEREQQRKDLVGLRNSLLEGQNVLYDLQNKDYGDGATQVSPTGGEFGMPTPTPEESGVV